MYQSVSAENTKPVLGEEQSTCSFDGNNLLIVTRGFAHFSNQELLHSDGGHAHVLPLTDHGS